jgi:hypothetical protein
VWVDDGKNCIIRICWASKVFCVEYAECCVEYAECCVEYAECCVEYAECCVEYAECCVEYAECCVEYAECCVELLLIKQYTMRSPKASIVRITVFCHKF